MAHEYEVIKYRLECLKMAYEVSFKMGCIKDFYEKDDHKIQDDLQDVFSMAEMNFQFVAHGKHPSEILKMDCDDEEESDQ